jgi:hypothetical protein
MVAVGFILLESKISKEKIKMRFCLGPVLSKRKILTYLSVLYSTVELLHPCPQHTAKGPPCAEISLQVVKRATKQTPFDLYRSATGLGRVAENANKL